MEEIEHEQLPFGCFSITDSLLTAASCAQIPPMYWLMQTMCRMKVVPAPEGQLFENQGDIQHLHGKVAPVQGSVLRKVGVGMGKRDPTWRKRDQRPLGQGWRKKEHLKMHFAGLISAGTTWPRLGGCPSRHNMQKPFFGHTKNISNIIMVFKIKFYFMLFI